MACDRPNYLLRHGMGEFLSFLFNRIECRNYKPLSQYIAIAKNFKKTIYFNIHHITRNNHQQ